MTYAETKTAFCARAAKLLPVALRDTLIITAISNQYPEFHYPTGDYACGADNADRVIADITALTDDEIRAIIAYHTPDFIIDIEPALTQPLADEIMTLARAVDPTESNIAAEIRDAIRDNHENVRV
jgi:hypothetical protein